MTMSEKAQKLQASIERAFSPLRAIVKVFDEIDGRLSVLVHVPDYLTSLAKLDATSPTCKELKAELDAIPDSGWVQGKFMQALVPRVVRWHQTEGFAYKYSGSWHLSLPYSPRVAALQDALNHDLGRRLNRPRMLLPIDISSVLINKYRHGNDSVMPHSDSQPLFGAEPTIVSVSCGAARPFDLFPMTTKVRTDDWTKRTKELEGLASYALKKAETAEINMKRATTTPTKERERIRAGQWAVIDAEVARMLQHVSFKATDDDDTRVDTKRQQVYTASKPLRIMIRAGDLVLMGGAMQDFWYHGLPKMSARGEVLRKAQDDALARQVDVRYNLTYRSANTPAQPGLKFDLPVSSYLASNRTIH